MPTRITMTLAAMLAAMLGATSATGAPVPACVQRAVTGEAAAASTIAAPIVEPTRGSPGTPIHIEGTGFKPGQTVYVVALYGEGDCGIVGLGDHLLGAARADADGSYRLDRPWPALFTPMLGRGTFPPTPLPDGRYFLITVACSERAACNLAGGSAPGGPFALGDTGQPVASAGEPDTGEDGPPVGALLGTAAGVIVIAGGLRFLRRLVDR